MRPDPNDPVLEWPLAPGEPGREVWYSLVSPRDGSAAFWYRYTLLSTESGRQEGRLWAALTDREEPTNSTFVSESVGLEDVRVDADPFELAVGDAVLTSSSASGEIASSAGNDVASSEGGEIGSSTGDEIASSAGGEARDVAWDLEYDPDTYAFTPLRSEVLTDLLARTVGTGRHWSRNQSVYMTGGVTVGDRTLELDDAPGHQGHTLSSDPPDRWTWVQCNDFEEDDSAVLEALQLDGTLTLCFRVDREIYPLNRLKHVIPYGPASNTVDHDEVGHWRFRGSGEGLELQATVEADPDHWQRVAYMAPDDTCRYNAHCSLSELTVTYSARGGEVRTVTSDAARAEWVSTEPPVEGDYRPSWD